MRFRRRSLLYLLYGMLVFTFIGIFWWSLPYDKLNMRQAIIRWSILIFIFSAVFRYIFHLLPAKLISSSLISLVGVLMVRILDDLPNDSSTHNLLLMELITGVLVAGLSSGAGVFFASLFMRKSGNKSLGKSEVEQLKRKRNSDNGYSK